MKRSPPGERDRPLTTTGRMLMAAAMTCVPHGVRTPHAQARREEGPARRPLRRASRLFEERHVNRAPRGDGGLAPRSEFRQPGASRRNGRVGRPAAWSDRESGVRCCTLCYPAFFVLYSVLASRTNTRISLALGLIPG